MTCPDETAAPLRAAWTRKQARRRSDSRRSPRPFGAPQLALAREDSLSSFASLRRGGSSDTSPMRRSFSDGLVTRGGAQEGLNYPPRTNATFHVAQRSGAPLVRDMIASIEDKTAARLAGGPNQGISAPESECGALANCALDPYYRVIIAASNGIPAVISAMAAFRGVEEVQASGCGALAAVCTKNASNQTTTARHGGIQVVLDAMRRYPYSISVQSAGCDALASLTSLTPGNVELLRNVEDFGDVMGRAREVFLPPSCREGADAVLRRMTHGG